MFITVHTKAGISADLKGNALASKPETQRLRDAVSKLGVILQPMHPGTKNSELAKQFFVQVADDAKAQAVVTNLRKCDAVEGVYLKSRDEPPG